jgi:hypothetical protein
LDATLGGPTMFARIGVMRALNRNVERVFNPTQSIIGDGGSWRATAENKKPPSVSGPMTASEYAHTSKRFTLSEFRKKG